MTDEVQNMRSSPAYFDAELHGLAVTRAAAREPVCSGAVFTAASEAMTTAQADHGETGVHFLIATLAEQLASATIALAKEWGVDPEQAMDLEELKVLRRHDRWGS